MNHYYLISFWRCYSNLIETSPDDIADDELFSSSSSSVASAASFSSTPDAGTLASLLLASSKFSIKSGTSSSSAPAKILNLVISH